MKINNIVAPVLILALAGCAPGSYPGSSYAGSSSPNSAYCARQPAVCVVIGVLVVGGLAALVNHNRRSGNTKMQYSTDNGS